MTTLSYNQVNTFLFDDIQQHQFVSSQTRELTDADIDSVSGGRNSKARGAAFLQCGLGTIGGGLMGYGATGSMMAGIGGAMAGAAGSCFRR